MDSEGTRQPAVPWSAPAEPDPQSAERASSKAGGGGFARLGGVVLGAAAERSLAGTLRRLVEGARELTRARYAALGVPDETGRAFRHFVHAGMPPDVVTALGPLPRTHGLLGAMLSDPRSYRTTDITRDPRFEGWPSAHPPMRHFLGMPLVTGDAIVGAFYLTGEAHDNPFTDEHHELMGVLAAHAAVAVDNARLLEVSRQSAVAEERARLSSELHDAVVQNLFGLRLTARTAARRLPSDPQGAARDLTSIDGLAEVALRELRAAIEHLQPPDLARDGLAKAVHAHARLISRGGNADVRVEADPPEQDRRWRSIEEATATALLRIAQEAMANSVRHSGAERVDVVVRHRSGRTEVTIGDDGRGFCPEADSGSGLGLPSMRERAAAVGANLSIASAPGQGTRVSVTTEART